ncbi:MAG TPA: iron-containing alcohol dehydrogenase, partial [Acidimicrobiales bacterium]|nr:iron-containing alcohol dehydrogenase [Acidimicrobiales bacterium]
GAPGDAAGAVDRLREAIGLPGRLSELGIDESELDVVARLSQGHRTIAGNPRPVGEDDARGILRSAW